MITFGKSSCARSFVFTPRYFVCLPFETVPAVLYFSTEKLLLRKKNYDDSVERDRVSESFKQFEPCFIARNNGEVQKFKFSLKGVNFGAKSWLGNAFSE